MERRRLDRPRSGAERLILFLYWLVSGYGLRAWRALAAVGILWLVVSWLLAGWGFAAAGSFPAALVYSAHTAIGVPHYVQITWWIVRSVLPGLALLSIRERVKRALGMCPVGGVGRGSAGSSPVWPGERVGRVHAEPAGVRVAGHEPAVVVDLPVTAPAG
ncbi:MAG: hypothetical protein ACRDYX_05915 [Egibacteraceae bacterium]